MKNETDIELNLDDYNFANLFNIVNLNEKSYFNLCKTIFFDKVDISMYEMYTVHDGDSWTYLSNKFYGTIKLWWLICKFNKITNPFLELREGLTLKILKKEYVNNILQAIKNA